MKKTMRKLIPSVIMLLISAMFVGTSTFAWFSMNTKVTVTGMTVSTKVSSNLMIADDTLASTAKKEDNQFTDHVNRELPAAILEPVSTQTGKAFFYTTNAKPDGDAVSDDYVAVSAAEVPTSEELTKFQGAYSTGATGAPYVDYVFQLYAMNTTDAEKYIKITKLDLVYAGASDTSKAYRVAVFVEDITSSAPAGGSGTLVGIYAPDGAANQSDVSSNNYAVGAAGTAPSQLTNNYNTASSLAPVAAGATKYYKVVFRLYLEGEDTTCKNSVYQSLTSDWKLRLELAIDHSGSLTNVNCISKYTHALVSTTDWYYDGDYVWDDINDIGNTSAGTAIASADSDVQTAFGYTAL